MRNPVTNKVRYSLKSARVRDILDSCLEFTHMHILHGI